MPFWCSEMWCDRLVFLLQAKIPFLKKNVLVFMIIYYCNYFYYNFLWLFHFLLCKALWIPTVYEMCYINKLALPCLYIQMNQTGISVYLNTLYLNKKPYTFNISSPGGGLLHVGVMLRAAERGDGHRGGPHPAARLWSRSWAVPLCPQRWLLHLPTQQHHLRKRRPGV